jgi:hypothetical protein
VSTLTDEDRAKRAQAIRELLESTAVAECDAVPYEHSSSKHEIDEDLAAYFERLGL